MILNSYLNEMANFCDKAPMAMKEQWLFINPVPLYLPAMIGFQLYEFEKVGFESKPLDTN